MMKFAGLIGVLLLSCSYRVSAGSCREAKLCCPGRDSSCVVQKAPINAIIEDLSDKPCYCDHACLKLGDCCTDFKDACGVVDCVVSPWGPWSACDAECGSGTMSRSRTVQMAPRNGGRRCPSLQQRRGCQVGNCPHHREQDLAAREMAMILPGSLSLSRHVNETSDIRRNLRMRDPQDHPEYDRDREYCVEFEILKASKACRKEPSYSALREGKQAIKPCVIKILNGTFTKRNNEEYPIPFPYLKRSERVCVRCESEALRKSLGWRCQGHGAEGRATRWTALSAPHCHGKWLRAHPAPDHACASETCSAGVRNSTFIFV